MTALIDHINVLIIFCALISAIAILWKGPKSPASAASIFFIGCVTTYIIGDYLPFGPIKTILIAGTFLLPYSFWVLSNRVFSDKPHPLRIILYLAIILLAVDYTSLYLHINGYCDCGHIISAISLFIILMAVYEAQNQKGVDLVEERRQTRTIFTYVISILILFTMVAELALSNRPPDLSKVFQRSSILIFSAYFLMANIRITDVFLGSHQKKPIIKNPELVNKIASVISVEKLYRKEALTIGQLSQIIDEREHLVRKAINRELGYRNFTDFINSFRIEEAKSLFSDPEKHDLTVLEVAYTVDFNSIRPFNRAFKLVTNQTPTEFRKNILRQQTENAG